MRKELNLTDMVNINAIIENSRIYQLSLFMGRDIRVPIDDRLLKEKENSDRAAIYTKNFINSLFTHYNSNRLSLFKKIFDYCHSVDVDLLTIFQNVIVKDDPKKYSNYPELVTLVCYAQKKGYFEESHDFLPYFRSFNRHIKEGLLSQIELLSVIKENLSEESFDKHMIVFDLYLSLNPRIKPDSQKNIKSYFDKFKDQPFYEKKSVGAEKFYINFLDDKENVSDFQVDSFATRRFCFSAEHQVRKLKENIEANIQFIYENFCSHLKESGHIEDFNTFEEQGSVYCYIFSKSEKTLDHIAECFEQIHKDIQPFLRNNDKTNEYFIALYEKVSLGINLPEKPDENNVSPKSLKI